MSYSVEDMCKAGGTTARGVRYWEEQGLLGEVERTSGNQRRYTNEQLDRARIIAAAKFAGWDLAEVKEMVEKYDNEAYEAIRLRLSQQMNAIMWLTENLPQPADALDYDL